MCHTNEAAAEARNKMFLMVYQFGLPAVFFTITPDDNNIFRMKVYASPNESHSPPEDGMDAENCLFELEFQSDLRTKYSGLSAFDFESVVDIVVKHIIGWDDEKHGPTEGGGIFGVPLAYTMAAEEQGRKMLHGHFLIWIKGWKELLQTLFC